MLRQSFAYFAIRAVNGVLALLALFVLTRLMSSEQYGLYALGVAAINIGAAVLFQGLGVAAARFWPEHAASPAALHREVRLIFLTITGLFFAAPAATFGVASLANWSPMVIAAVFCGAVAMGLHTVNLQLANAQGHALRYAKLTASRAGLTLIVATILVMQGLGTIGALFAVTVGALAAVMTFGVMRWFGSGSERNPALRKDVLRYTAPLSAVFVATMMLDQADRFLIGWWYGPSKVAGYAAAYDLAQQSVGAILNVCFLAGFPRVIAAWEADGAEAARRALQLQSRLVLLLAPLSAAVLFGFAAEISRGMLGASLRDDATAAIPWIAVAVALLGLRAYVFDIAFHVVKATRPLFLIAVMMAAVSLAANIVLLPSMGVVGAAMAATLAAAAGALASWWVGRHRRIYPRIGVELVKGFFAAAGLIAIARLPWWSALEPGAAAVGPAGQALLLLVRFTIGLAAFGAVACIGNLCGVRDWLLARWRRS